MSDEIQMLTATKAAALCGISRRFFHQLLLKGRGPVAVDVGGIKFYPRDRVLEWNRTRRKLKKGAL